MGLLFYVLYKKQSGFLLNEVFIRAPGEPNR